MNRRPQDFREWRDEWHQVCFEIGSSFCPFVTWSPRMKKKPVVDKYVWSLIHRARGIRAHLDAECEANTASYQEVFLETFGVGEDEQ